MSTETMPDQAVAGLVKQFLALKTGDSVFFEGYKRADLNFLHVAIEAAGAGIHMAYTLNDEIFGTAGTRAWRQAGNYDDEL